MSATPAQDARTLLWFLGSLHTCKPLLPSLALNLALGFPRHVLVAARADRTALSNDRSAAANATPNVIARSPQNPRHAFGADLVTAPRRPSVQGPAGNGWAHRTYVRASVSWTRRSPADLRQNYRM